jgi:hypothetical protein
VLVDHHVDDKEERSASEYRAGCPEFVKYLNRKETALRR